MESQLKGIREEADKEKALKQVANDSLNEKNFEMTAIEWRETMAEKAQELAE